MKVAKERKSSILASNAVHHRIDSLTSIVALLTIGGSHLLHDGSWLDPVGGLIISAMVIQAGAANTRTALRELADQAVDPDVRAAVRHAAVDAHVDLPATAAASAPGNAVDRLWSVRDVQGIKSGQNYLIDLEVAVPRTWSVDYTRHLEAALRHAVARRLRAVRRLRVRFVPADPDLTSPEPAFHDEFIPVDRSPRASPEPDHPADHHTPSQKAPSDDSLRKRQ
jgi:divalent metal cation (Fe/Co/Zn/Cd) transporter